MLKNYIKIAWRRFLKNKIDSSISVVGLAVGLACCILLLAYVRFEWSHDRFHKKSDRIYRLTTENINSQTGEVQYMLGTPYPLSAALDETYPEIEKAIDFGKARIHYKQDGQFVSQATLLAGPGFFEYFSFPLLYGNNQTALSRPNDVVISEQLAQQIFGKKQVIGEPISIRLNGKVYTYSVSGVAEPVPSNSSIQFDMVLPHSSELRTMSPQQREIFRNSWYMGSGETWVVLEKKASADALELKFSGFLNNHYGENSLSFIDQMGLQSITDAYFSQEYRSHITGNSNIWYSMILGGTAVLILAIAAINFMSLTLSRAVNRANETGIRKSVGAERWQVGLQILSEVFIICLIALVIGLVLAELFTPVFEQIISKPVALHIITQPVLWFALLILLITLTLFTGVYPAFVISRRKATRLFSSQRTAKGNPLFVKGLICFQFALTISFLIGTFVMRKQLNYIFNKDLGFNTSNVLAIELNTQESNARDMAKLYQQEIKQIPGIEQVALTSGSYRFMPGLTSDYGIGMGMRKSSTTLDSLGDLITQEIVDENYIEAMGIDLIEGRNFSAASLSDLKNGILINKQFSDAMGWEHPVGRIIRDRRDDYEAPFNGKKVIGVIENYHYQSLFNQLQPIALIHFESQEKALPATILIKTATSDMSTYLPKLSTLWEKLVPEETFKYSFVDELVDAQYQEEQRWNRIMALASGMAIILACFGLFGLVALSARQRTKEIGIRKVLGASVANIIGLISKDFLKLVVIGFIIAIPIGWYATNLWLANFAYRIDIGAGVFMLAGGMALLIALITVSWQSIRAALANPVDSLRSE